MPQTCLTRLDPWFLIIKPLLVMLFKEEPLLLTSKPNVHKPEQLRSLHRDKAVASKLQTVAQGLFLMRLLAPSARRTRPMSLPSPEA